MNFPCALGVNIDHVATLRQIRLADYPDPIHLALEAEMGGADGITLHLREDRRHIQYEDVTALKARLQTKMNLEMAMTDSMVAIACEIRPDACCIVPEKRLELTTEGGLDVRRDISRARDVCMCLREVGIEVSFFVDPDRTQIDAAASVGADVVEIHTGHYASVREAGLRKEALVVIEQAISHAVQLGLVVNAGHGLNYHNVQPIASIHAIRELNIGHAIVARALYCGMKAAVHEMKRLMGGCRVY